VDVVDSGQKVFVNVQDRSNSESDDDDTDDENTAYACPEEGREDSPS
jgi:hypothetical protein